MLIVSRGFQSPKNVLNVELRLKSGFERAYIWPLYIEEAHSTLARTHTSTKKMPRTRTRPVRPVRPPVEQQRCYVCPARGVWPKSQTAEMGEMSPLCAAHYRTWKFMCQYCFQLTGNDKGTFRNDYDIVTCRDCFQKLQRGELSHEPHEACCANCHAKIKGAEHWAVYDSILTIVCEKCTPTIH